MTTFCVDPHVTHPSSFFLSRGLSNLPSEIQRAQASNVSIPKEPAYSKVYICPSGAQAGSCCVALCMLPFGAPLGESNIDCSGSVAQLLIYMPEGSEPQTAFGLACACSTSSLGHLSLKAVWSQT